MTTSTPMNATPVKSITMSKVLGPVLAMAVIGTSLVYAAGFAHSEALHDAAHDVRHATGFPCH